MAEGSSEKSDYGAFMEKFTLMAQPSSEQLPLSGLSFAVKDIFDVEGYVTGFGNPDWLRTHSAATSTAPAVLDVLNAGAKCVGKTIMDEMAYRYLSSESVKRNEFNFVPCKLEDKVHFFGSINGENVHYGTPTNPLAKDRVPGGSSSGSAVAVAVGAMLVDFSLGTDTGGSVRVPASYCGIYGFRPSHGIISTSGVVPLAQSFDTVGWFARDPVILNQVGRILLKLQDDGPLKLGRVIIAEDCFKLLSIPSNQLTEVFISSVQKIYGSRTIEYTTLGNFIESNVPILKHFMDGKTQNQDYNIPSLATLSSAMRLLERHEFKKNHGEWVNLVKPDLGPGISERVWEAIRSTDDSIEECYSLKTELQAALSTLLGDYGVLAMPTVPGPPPKLQTEPKALETFRAKAFSLLSVAGVSGFCQVSIPLGVYDNLPVAISLLAKNGSDGFLLKFAESIDETLKELSQNY